MQSSTLEFKDKFIAYIDILGWKMLVEAAEAGTHGITLDVLRDLLAKLGSPDKRNEYAKDGPLICPDSRYLQRDLDFRLSKAYDCAVVSTEISPAGAINLLAQCWSAVMGLLGRGFMCRGYITRGLICHTDAYCIGTGHQKALEGEKSVSAFRRRADENGTPFVEIDSVVCDYIKGCGDPCLRKVFEGYVKEDGRVVALFPIQRLSHQFIIAGYGHTCVPQEERRANHEMRLLLRTLKERVLAHVDTSNPRACEKAEHYIQAIDGQMEICDSIDELITKLESPFPAQLNRQKATSN